MGVPLSIVLSGEMGFSDKPTGEVTGDVDMNDFGSGSTDSLVSTAGGLWGVKMGATGPVLWRSQKNQCFVSSGSGSTSHLGGLLWHVQWWLFAISQLRALPSSSQFSSFSP